MAPLTLFKLRSFLAYVDLLGTTYSAPSLATGYGNHIAQPLLRRALERAGSEQDGWKQLEEADARKIVENAMKVLFYRDARSLNKVSERGLASTSRSCALMTTGCCAVSSRDCDGRPWRRNLGTDRGADRGACWRLYHH